MRRDSAAATVAFVSGALLAVALLVGYAAALESRRKCVNLSCECHVGPCPDAPGCSGCGTPPPAPEPKPVPKPPKPKG